MVSASPTPDRKVLDRLPLEDFSAFGEYALAAQQATELALSRATESGRAGRIPIAGAAVQLLEDGMTCNIICVGCNDRIPAGDGCSGYPTDHGETGALRNIHDFSACNWSRTVFATTLSPCIMCTRSLIHLHGLGLKRIVIAEAKSFPGRKELLEALPGMQIVELTNPDGIKMMDTFARRYPWDWAADIGEVPPAASSKPASPHAAWALLREQGKQAAVVAPDGTVVATASDERVASAGNPVRCATMRAFGLAGSEVNLREHTLVLRGDGTLITLNTFGLSALGACELFRPCAAIFDSPVSAELRAALTAAGIHVEEKTDRDAEHGGKRPRRGSS